MTRRPGKPDGPVLTRAQVVEAVRLITLGMPHKKVAKQFGVSDATIRRAEMREAGA